MCFLTGIHVNIIHAAVINMNREQVEIGQDVGIASDSCKYVQRYWQLD